MATRTIHHTPFLFIAGLSLILLASLVFCSSSWANSSDWGLVQRFQTQLEQAQAGKVKAMYEVGRLYERGRGTNKSLENAANWYQKAVDNGSDSAKARLGTMYLEGRGIKKDLRKAYKLLSDAAKKDISGAQYQLAIMYEIGIGIDEDTSKALYWYRKAAALGHYQAERKAAKLARAPSSPYISAPVKPKAKPQVKAKTVAKKATPVSSNLIETIARGSWTQRKRAAGYLPSSISNCKKVGNKELVCISTEQERNTGNEIISFNTEATIKATGGKNFTVDYSNNVLDVELVQRDAPSGVEGDDETESSSAAKNSIHKGKQGKVHHLVCKLNSNKAISCIKNSIRTLEFKS